MRRVGALLSAFSCLFLAGPATAEFGDGSTGGGVTNGAIWAGVQFSSPPASSSSSDGNGCTWRLASPHDAGIGNETGAVTRVLDGITYTLYERSCAGSSVYLWVPQPGDSQLAQQAASTIYGRLPAPSPRTAPPAQSGVVNVGMWFWTDPSTWAPVGVTAWVPTPGGVLWARTTATPVRLVYSGGEFGRSDVACTGPGQVWTAADGDDAASSCMFTYQHAGSYSGSLGIEWWISFTSSRGVSGSLGTYVTRSTLPVAVKEIQALVTS